MSKIDDALTEIKQYLSGNDHSDNPRIRQAAIIYSQACRELNSKLSECRQLIDKGLLIDAQKLDQEMQPSLSERAEKLMLPQAVFNRYQELCRLYGYTTAPDIDRPALTKLNQAPCGKEEILKTNSVFIETIHASCIKNTIRFVITTKVNFTSA